MVQPMTSKDKQLVQQPIIALVPTNVQVTTNLPIYVCRWFDHQPLHGGQPRDSPGRSSFRRDLLGELTFNPLVASFGWLRCHTRSYNTQPMSKTLI